MVTRQKRADVFVSLAQDPREGRPRPVGERAVLLEFVRLQRMTLELKCAGLDAEALARRAVPPSTMSLLGLVRHMAEVERVWSERRLGGRSREQVPPLYTSEGDPDGDFDGAVADPVVVESAWRTWRAQCAHTDAFVEGVSDLEAVTWTDPYNGQVLDVRQVLVHMVQEYARHNGHADLLRERVDGRLGQ